MFFCYFFFVSRRIDPPGVQIPFRAPREPLCRLPSPSLYGCSRSGSRVFSNALHRGRFPGSFTPKTSDKHTQRARIVCPSDAAGGIFLERGGGQKQRRRHSHGVSAQSKVSRHNISIRQKVADARHEALQYFMVCKVAVRSRRCFFVERNSAGDFSDTP